MPRDQYPAWRRKTANSNRPASTRRRFLVGGLVTASLVAVIAAFSWPEAPAKVVLGPDIPGLEEVPPPAAATLASVSEEPLAAEIARILTVNRGDTLMKLLEQEGIDRRDAHNAIEAMKKVFDPRYLKAGQELSLVVVPPGESDKTEFVSLRMAETPVRDITVVATADGDFKAEAVDRPTERVLHRTDGTIKTSLYEAAIKASVPVRVLADLINVFSFDVDFQREIQKNDGFALMYESIVDDHGNVVDNGAVLIGEMTLSGKTRRYYRFKGRDGFVDYFNEKGQSVRKALLRTPVEGARISSRYGKRKHPVLGYTKMHKGLDFAAPKGTPIFAAGNGIVEAAGWNGGYGKYIRIRHNGTFKTAYAHLSRIDKRVKKGARVKQRQIIGYVGTTGRSTGPHLHYEVHKNGKQTNPLGVKLPTGRTLKGDELAEFQQYRAKLEAQYAEIETGTRVAKVDTVE